MERHNERRDNCREYAMQQFLKHYEFVQMIAFESAPSKHLIEDIVNDTFIVFVEKAESWDYKNIKGILAAITRNVAMNSWQNYMKTLPESLRKIAMYLIREPSPSEMTAQEMKDDRLAILRLCMGQLTDRSRRLVEEYYMSGRKLNEIAEELSENQSSIRNRIFRIRVALRGCVEKMEKKGTINE